MALSNILDDTPVDTIDEAVAIMDAIDGDLPDADGVKWFNRLYLRVTEEVRGALGSTTFGDPEFIETLDVVFANLYFSALTSGLTSAAAAPAAWRPLLEARQTAGIARIQFALAGMNAHINRDLPDGIVRSFVAMGGIPLTDRVREHDFYSCNDLLAQVEEQVKAEFTVGPLGVLDRLGGPLDDAVAMWNVRAARTTAWTNAQVLWGLSPLPFLRDRFFGRLDSLVGMSGRGLLVRLDQIT